MFAFCTALWRYAGGRRLSLLLTLMLLCALIEGFGLYLLVPVLRALDSQGTATLTLPVVGLRTWPLSVWLGLFIAIVGARIALSNRRNLDTARLRLGFVEALRNQLQSAIARAEWRFLTTTAHADLNQILSSELRRIDIGSWCLLQLGVSLLLAAAALLVALSLAPALTLLTVVLGASLSLSLRPKLHQTEALGKALSEADQAFFASSADFFNGLKLLKSAGAEAQHVADYAAKTRQLSTLELQFMVCQGRSQAWLAMGSALLIALILLISVRWLQLPTTELLLLLLIFARLLPLTSQGFYQLQMVRHMLPAYAAYARSLQQCQAAAEIVNDGPEPTDAQALPLVTALRCTSVVFCYPAKTAPALNRINVTIPARQTTALIGPSGAGKTTLADLLLGLLTPDRGSIDLDQMPLSESNRGRWRRSVGYVPQDAFLFPDTVRVNLLWANSPTAEESLWQVLELAAAADFVRALPQGLDTMVGERGIRLSGGERQRLALARALLRKPTLLVLDEATSQLDSENERLIQTALQHLHGQMTVVVIAHRLSTIQHADNIIVLENGAIVEQGNWQSLITAQGRFKDLLEASLQPAPGKQERP